MTSWADIQRLASDLQRVQLSESSKKLSEVNCVEVISKLIQNSQIDVVFTRDGQSYVTKKHLETEIKNECMAAGGRAPLTDIAVSLNIDFDHIERTARLIVSHEEDFKLSNAELFSSEYVHRLLNELRELLEENGNQTKSELCKHWELSPELLQSLLIDQLPIDFRGLVDGDTIYTNQFLQSRKMILRAVLSAITKSTTITSIQKRIGLTNRRFWIAYDELVAEGEVPGHLVGSRTSPACVYTPGMYDTLVKSCVLNALRQDEYLQISTLKKLNIDGKAGLENVIGKSEAAKLEILNSIYITDSLLETCLASVQEELHKSGICEVRLALQPLNIPFDENDEDFVGERVAENDKDVSFAEGYVFKSSILAEALGSVAENIEKKAHLEVDRLEKEKKQGGKPAKVVDEADDWGDKKGGKGGKKGGKGGGKGASKGGSGATTAVGGSAAVIVNEEELEEWLKGAKSVPEEILSFVVEKILSEATTNLRKKVAEITASQLTANAASTKKSLLSIAEKIRQIYDSFCTFEIATTSFSEPLGSDLRQFLLKTIGLEVANGILSYATGVDNAHQLKEKQRDETIDALPQNLQTPLKSLFAALKSPDGSDSSIDAFHDAVYDCSIPSATSLSLKKADKKTRYDVGGKLAEELKAQISTTTDQATTLLVVVLYILAKNGRPTTASGKFVAQMIAQIKESCSEEIFELLSSCQKGVVTCIKNKDDDVSKEMLNDDIAKLKAAVLEL